LKVQLLQEFKKSVNSAETAGLGKRTVYEEGRIVFPTGVFKSGPSDGDGEVILEEALPRMHLNGLSVGSSWCVR
jgi:hypothetical protein